MFWYLCFVGHTKLSKKGKFIGEKDWLQNLMFGKCKKLRVVFVLERESAGIQQQGKFFAFGSVERWAVVACQQSITPFPSPSESGERWPRGRLLSGKVPRQKVHGQKVQRQ